MAIAYNPLLATRDIGTIHAWINEGCDIDQDILPTLKYIMGKKPGITAFKYFSNPVREAKEKRLLRAKAAQEHAQHPVEYYIKIYAWKRSRGLSLTFQQEAELKAYEAKEKGHQSMT